MDRTGDSRQKQSFRQTTGKDRQFGELDHFIKLEEAGKTNKKIIAIAKFLPSTMNYLFAQQSILVELKFLIAQSSSLFI